MVPVYLVPVYQPRMGLSFLEYQTNILELALLMNYQIGFVTRNTFFYLELPHKLAPYLDLADLATLTHASITSRVEHCNVLYMPLKSIQKCQLVQKFSSKTPASYQWLGTYNPSCESAGYLSDSRPIQGAGYHL